MRLTTLVEIEALYELDSDAEEGWVIGCGPRFCYHNLPLCPECGDVVGRKAEPDDCMTCYDEWAESQWTRYFNRSPRTAVASQA